MDLIAISPPDTCADEKRWIGRLLDAGLTRYHVRKPGWSAAILDAFLQQIPPPYRAHLALHQHHVLVQKHALGGWHVKDDVGSGQGPPAVSGTLPTGRPVISRSLHRISALANDTKGWDAAFLSPVFASFSKPGHQPHWTEAELLRMLREPRCAKLYALGGIDAARAPQCRDWGFDGLVLHGALWRSNDPLAAFETIRRRLS